jgi:hypothetical protein
MDVYPQIASRRSVMTGMLFHRLMEYKWGCPKREISARPLKKSKPKKAVRLAILGFFMSLHLNLKWTFWTAPDSPSRSKQRESRKNRVSGEAEAADGAESRKNRVSGEAEAAEGAESRKNRVSDEVEAADGAESRKNRVSDEVEAVEAA